MTQELTRLAVENRQVLEYLALPSSRPDTAKALADVFERDRSNFHKALRGLESEGWLIVNKPGKAPAVELTPAGLQAAQAFGVAANRLQTALPPLLHSQIRPDPDQPRKTFEEEDDQALAENIAERGLLQPILISMTGPDAAMIVAGERRWRAIGRLIAAGDPRWPAGQPVPYHLSAKTDRGEVLADQIVENVQRAKLTALEEAQSYRTLKEQYGWGVGRISKEVGKVRRTIEQRLDLLNLPAGQQARLQLPSDHPDHLTPTRAREVLAHLRQIAEASAQQTDIEDLVPRPEDEQAARAVKLEPWAMLTLAEIADAVATRPSSSFPFSPMAVTLAEAGKAARSPDLGLLIKAKFAEIMTGQEADDEPLGVRILPLGHLRLRLESLHPADNARALFHLRREVGISADIARQAAATGRYSTGFLNLPEPQRLGDQGGHASSSAVPSVGALVEQMRADARRGGQSGGEDLDEEAGEGFSKAVQDTALATSRAEPGCESNICAKLSGTTTVEGEAWPAMPTEAIRTPWEGYPSAEIRLTVSSQGRWGFSLKTATKTSGQSSPPYVYSNDRLFRSRAAALAVAIPEIVERFGEYARQRKVQAWVAAALAERFDPPAEAAEQPPAPDLNPVQLRILRELWRAQVMGSKTGDQPVPVGRYWLDLDAVNLWKMQPAGLLAFTADPGAGWKAALTPAGLAALDGKNQQPRPLASGTFETDWLKPETSALTAPHGPTQLDATDPATPAEAEDQALLQQVRAGLDQGAPDFAQLLALAGLAGPFTVDGDAAIADAAQASVAVVDPWREASEGLAQARAELITWALNLAIGGVQIADVEGDDPDAKLRTAARHMCHELARLIPPATPLFAEVGAAYGPLSLALNDATWAAKRRAQATHATQSEDTAHG